MLKNDSDIKINDVSKLSIQYCNSKNVLNIISCFKNLEILHIKNTYIDSLYRLKDLTNLKELVISNSILDDIKFPELKNLTCLEILNTDIFFLNLNEISSSSNLKYIGLDGVQFEDSLINSIKRLKNLKSLLLRNCEFSSTPFLSELDSLEYLLLDNIQGINFDSLLKSVQRKLKVISITNCHLRTLPNSIFEQKKLEELILNGNHISQLPESICNLENLLQLSIDNNDLKQLPNSICKLKKLKFLSIRYNEIEDLEMFRENTIIGLTIQAKGTLLNKSKIKMKENMYPFITIIY